MQWCYEISIVISKTYIILHIIYIFNSAIEFRKT